MATLVLTVIGGDKTGLVDALADPIAEHGGSWERSHLARLAGQFAGIVVIRVPDAEVVALTSAFETLNATGLLDIRVAIASADSSAEAAVATTETSLRLHLVGQDRPGIIREISASLAAQNVSIDELITSTQSAPMSAEPLFEASATLRLPHGVDAAKVRDALESIANEMMVDLDFAAE